MPQKDAAASRPDYATMHAAIRLALAAGRANAGAWKIVHVAKIERLFDDVFERAVFDAAAHGEDKVMIYSSCFGVRESAFERAIMDMEAWMQARVAPFNLHTIFKKSKSHIFVDLS